jgi:hypothetical protein
LICISACSRRDDATPNELDYYPIEEDSKWIYTSDKSSGGLLSTQVVGDTILDGKNYAIVGGTNPLHTSSLLVRKENGRYYGRRDSYGIYSPEYIFLQDQLPAGGSWTNETPVGIEVNTIVSKDDKRTIGDKEYAHTIEVKTEYYDKNNIPAGFTHRNIFAKGVGVVAWSMNQSQLLLTEYEIK